MTQFNEDELEAPQWINENFFKKIFENNGSEIEIEQMIITPGTNKGDHFASIMFRAKITYRVLATGEQKCESLIIKTMPTKEGRKKDILETKSFFETEIGMYNEVLPKVEKILMDIGENNKLCARVRYSSLKPHKCIVLEDLKEKDYTVASDCTLEEVMLSLEKLAKYHAVTHKILMEDEMSFLSYKQQYFVLTERTKILYANTIKFLTNVIRKESRLQKFAPYMEKLDERFIANAVNLVDSENIKHISNMLVLTHGDFHKKNMMMKYNEDVLNCLLLLDFQMSCCGSVVQDLLYAYFMLFTPSMRLPESRKQLFSHYFETYQNTLKALRYTGHIPTQKEFDEELKRFKLFELFLLAFILPIGYCLGDCIEYLSELIDPKVQKKVYERPELLKELESILQWYIDEGYFNEI